MNKMVFIIILQKKILIVKTVCRQKSIKLFFENEQNGFDNYFTKTLLIVKTFCCDISPSYWVALGKHSSPQDITLYSSWIWKVWNAGSSVTLNCCREYKVRLDFKLQINGFWSILIKKVFTLAKSPKKKHLCWL